jgi:hypothetical protein
LGFFFIQKGIFVYPPPFIMLFEALWLPNDLIPQPLLPAYATLDKIGGALPSATIGCARHNAKKKCLLLSLAR